MKIPDSIRAKIAELDPAAQTVIELILHMYGEQSLRLQALEAQLATYQRMLFGSRSEKLPPISDAVRRQIEEEEFAEGYEWLNCCDDSDDEVFVTLDGSSQAGRWQPIKVRRVRADDRHDFKPSDFPWLGEHALVMRREAVDVLRDVLEAHGEVLPLVTEDATELWMFNARAIDALDEGRSNIVRFPGTNRIMRIVKIAFVESALRGVDIFRLPHRASSTYVSQRFFDRVRDAGLVGLEFKKVWSSS